MGLGERQNTIRNGVTHTTVQDDRRTGVGWESADAGSTQCDRDEEDSKVHILRDLTVTPHEASVDVLAVSKGRLAAEQILETSNNFPTVIEDSVGDSSSVDSEEHPIEEGIGGGEISRGISLVTRLVEHGVPIDDLQDLVTRSGVVPNVVIVDGDVARVPGVGVPNREDDRGGDERAEETVKDTVEGVDEGVSGDGKLVPVPGREGVETKTANSAGNCSQADVVRGDPGHPVEVGRRLNDVVWEPEVDKHSAEAIHEPPHPRDGPTVNGLVRLHVEGTLRGS